MTKALSKSAPVPGFVQTETDCNEKATNGNTLIMGIIGDPINQVKTPEAINPIFARLGANITCVPFHVTTAELESAWKGLKSMRNLVGFGVTLPHKVAVMSLCDSLDETASRVGAVNVVRREADGLFRGYQFDGFGFVRGLETRGHLLSGRNCLLVGAGGAANGIAYALKEAGCARLRIANRNMAKAAALVDQLNGDFGPGSAEASAAFPQVGDIVINATSLGMNEEEPMPVDPELLDETMLVADVIAKPEFTALLAAASDRGASIHSGLHMLNNQVDLIARHIVDVQSADTIYKSLI